jgi:hypothetical protein
MPLALNRARSVTAQFERGKSGNKGVNRKFETSRIKQYRIWTLIR